MLLGDQISMETRDLELLAFLLEYYATIQVLLLTNTSKNHETHYFTSLLIAEPSSYCATA